MMEKMTINYACRLLQKETSSDEIEKLKYKNGFNQEKTLKTINDAIDLLCDTAKKYEVLINEKN